MKLAIFDFDGTLLDHDTLPCLGDAWRRQGRSRLAYYRTLLYLLPILYHYKTRRISTLAMKQIMMKRFIILFRGMHQAEIKQFFSQSYEYMSGFFNPLVVQEIQRTNQEGYHTVLLSGTFQELLEVVAEQLHIATSIGSQVIYAAEGHIDVSQPVESVIGADKLTKLTQYFNGQTIDWQNSISYADSYTDLSILEPAGTPILINPDPELLAWGQQHHCQVIVSG